MKCLDELWTKFSYNDDSKQYLPFCYTAVEEVKPKKFFVQHVDTVSSSDVTVDVLQSFVTSKVIFKYLSSSSCPCFSSII